MAQRLAIVLTVGLLLAAIALVFTDSFYAALDVRPEDAGVSDVDVAVRGLVYLSLVVFAVALLPTAALVGIRAILKRRWPDHDVVLWVPAILAATGAAVLVLALIVPGFLRFALDSWSRALGSVIVALSLAAVVALISQMSAGPAGTIPSRLALLAFVAIAIGGIPAGLLARSAGRELARDARNTVTLTPGPFDPMRIRATPACVLPSTPSQEVAPVKLWVKLGASSAGVVLYEPDVERSIVISPTRVGVLGVAKEVCRRPGEPAPVETGTPAEDAALAQRFRPVLWFDRREPWRPLNVERFLSETFPDSPVHHEVCSSDGHCEDIQASADLTPRWATIDIRGNEHNGSDYYSPGVPGCNPPKPTLECPDGDSSIYYHVTRQDHRVYVDYWWFFRYDHVPAPAFHGRVCDGPPVSAFEHEGDWEGVTAVSEFNRPGRLDYVAYSGHGFAVRYPRGVMSLAPETEDNPKSQRPLVYVACGTHAAYPRPCAGPKGCRETRVRCSRLPCAKPVSKISEAPFDGDVPWDRNDDAECFTISPCLQPLPPGSAGEPGWATWPGRWGENHGPRSPGTQGPYVRPWEVVSSNRTEFGKSEMPGVTPDAQAGG